MKTQDETVKSVGSTPAEKLIAAVEVWGRHWALLDAITAYHAAPLDPWAKLFAEVREALCVAEPGADALIDVVTARERAGDAGQAIICGDHAHARAATLAVITRSMLALRALGQESGK